MSMDVKHNADGSVTVSSESDAITIFPGTAVAGAGTNRTEPAALADSPDVPINTWPGPVAMTIVGHSSANAPGAALDGVSVGQLHQLHLDQLSGGLRLNSRARAELQGYANALPKGQAVPVVINSPLGHPFELGPVLVELKGLEADLGRPITAYLSASTRSGSSK